MVVYTRLDTFSESIFAYAFHTIGDDDRSKVIAIKESIISYTCHAVAYGDCFEAKAAIKCTFSNTLHTIGDDDRGETATKIESSITNTCYTTEYTRIFTTV